MERTPSKLSSPGPYLAEVINHLDDSYMGGLEVILKTRRPAPANVKANTYSVKYMTPFYGVTSWKFLGNNDSSYNDTQKSYGMWMIPPDVGTTVMVIFVDSDPGQGYWIGCIPEFLQNYMVPGIAASPNYKSNQAQNTDYKGSTSLPVAEYNKIKNQLPDIASARRPIHPFADVLTKQGLLLDDIRGVTSSSARREQPSMVFGISTPGPLDPTGPKGAIGYGDKSRQTPISRLGGSSFVMDDGDIDGNNELIRLRTRTGHQLLMHNTADLIYLGNSKGTAWLEFSSDGKIDIYAADSVSIHTQADFNLKADRDFNLHAGRNFNIVADQNINLHASSSLSSEAGTILTHTLGNYTLTAGKNLSMSANGAIATTSTGRISIESVRESVSIEAQNAVSIYSTSTITIDSSRTSIFDGSRRVEGYYADTDKPTGIQLFLNPNTLPDDKAKKSGTISAMVRVPQREPWSQHENLDRAAFSSANTDASGGGSILSTPKSSIKFSTARVAGSVPLKMLKAGVDRGMVGTEITPWSIDEPFKNKLKEVAATLGVKPIDLIAVMHSETGGTLNPAEPNKADGKAMGLIQFMPATAIGLNTTRENLSNMSRVEQLAYVEKFFRVNHLPKGADETRIYATTFLPAYASRPGPILVTPDSGVPLDKQFYEKNKYFDPGNLGYITFEGIGKRATEHKNQAIEILKNNGYDADLNPLKPK